MSISTIYELLAILLGIMFVYACYRTFDRHIFPMLVERKTKNIEKNPKWITPKLQKEYYGFKDIDIIVVEDPFNCVPRYRISKENHNRLELLISEDITTNDIEYIAQVALAGKIKIKYGLWFPDKPAYWLSVLCFMLDGGNIQLTDKKRVDLD